MCGMPKIKKYSSSRVVLECANFLPLHNYVVTHFDASYYNKRLAKISFVLLIILSIFLFIMYLLLLILI